MFKKLKKLLNSRVTVLIAMLGFFVAGTMKVATAETNYDFANVFQYFMLDNRAQSIQNQGKDGAKIPVLGSVGSGGVTGSFSYSEIVNSAPGSGATKKANQETARQFAIEMATYSTFRYFTNRVQGFESMVSYIGRVCSFGLVPLALSLDLVKLLFGGLVTILAKFNIIPLLGAALTNFGFQSTLSEAMGVPKNTINNIVNLCLGFTVISILIALLMTLRNGSTNPDSKWWRKFKGRVFTFLCLPIVIGIGASVLQEAGKMAADIPGFQSSFLNYLVDDRSWAYNYNFAPNGDSASSSTLSSKEGFVDLSFDPYTAKGQERIKQINSKSSIVGNDNVFANTAILLSYAMQDHFSAVDYINYQGSEESKKAGTYGSYYDYANNFTEKKLTDVSQAYVPSTGTTYGNKKDQEGPYKAAINDYKVEKNGKTSLNTSKSTAWRDRFIYGVKNAGDLSKYYGESPSQEMVQNKVGGTKASTIPSDQSMFLILSTIFDETGGRYYISAPARGGAAIVGKFDSNRADYYSVSMVGTPLFTVAALISEPLITLVCIAAAVIAMLSVGLLEMNLKPASALGKAIFIGDVEYDEAFIIYSFGIFGNAFVFAGMPHIMIGVFTGLSNAIIKGIPTILKQTPTSPQSSLAYNGSTKLLLGAIAITIAIMWFKSAKFRNMLSLIYTYVWNIALEAGEKIERSVGGGRYSAKQMLRKQERSNPILKAMADYDRKMQRFGQKTRGEDPLPPLDPEEQIPDPDDIIHSEHENSNPNGPNPLDPNNAASHKKFKEADDIKREGQYERLDNELKDIQNDSDLDSDDMDKVLDAQDAVNELRTHPSQDTFNAAKESLWDLRDQLVANGASEANIAAVDRALAEVEDIGNGYDFDNEDLDKQVPTNAEQKDRVDGPIKSTAANIALMALKRNPTQRNFDVAKRSLQNLRQQLVDNGGSAQDIAAVDRALNNVNAFGEKHGFSTVDNKPGPTENIKVSENVGKDIDLSQSLNTLKADPTQENFDQTKDHLQRVRKQLVEHGGSAKDVAAVDKALNKVNEFGKQHGLTNVEDRTKPTEDIKVSENAGKGMNLSQSLNTLKADPTQENFDQTKDHLQRVRKQLVEHDGSAKDIAAVDKALNKVNEFGKQHGLTNVEDTSKPASTVKVSENAGKNADFSQSKHVLKTNFAEDGQVEKTKSVSPQKALINFKKHPTEITFNTVERSLQEARTRIVEKDGTIDELAAVEHKLAKVRSIGKKYGFQSIGDTSKITDLQSVKGNTIKTQKLPDRLIRHTENVFEDVKNEQTIHHQNMRNVFNTQHHKKNIITTNQLRSVVSSLGATARDDKVVKVLRQLGNSNNLSDIKRNTRDLQRVVRALDSSQKEKINKKMFIKSIYDLNNRNNFGGNK